MYSVLCPSPDYLSFLFFPLFPSHCLRPLFLTPQHLASLSADPSTPSTNGESATPVANHLFTINKDAEVLEPSEA